MEINLAGDVPIYRQIYSAIITAIASGKLQEGQSLPTVRRLAEEIGVNMHTVNKAYSLLRSEGYIEMNRRRGAVISPPGHMQEDIRRISEELRSVAAQALGKNVPREKFMEMCELAYDNLEGGN